MCLLDRPAADHSLPYPERLLLWSLRAWVVGMRQRLDALVPIRSAFDQADAPAAAELVDALMSVIACGATRVLTVECVCHKGASEDESRLLVPATLHQAGRGREARFVLRDMLAPAASGDASELLDRIGSALATAGLRLSRIPGATQRFAFASETAVLGPTLH
jgi:hypothetical protein